MQLTITQQDSVLKAFFARTYSWMFAGLLLTAAIAYFTVNNEATFAWARSSIFLLLILQLAIVAGLSFLIQRVSAVVASVLFMVYAALNGLTFSLIIARYDPSAVTAAFITTAGMFGVMSLFGYFTRINLTRFGGILLMALIGLVIASIVNIFVLSGPLSFIISLVGVVLFSILTAYDTQRLREIALSGSFGEVRSESGEKLAVFGALSLYLDFINLFLYLLRLFGGGGNRN